MKKIILYIAFTLSTITVFAQQKVSGCFIKMIYPIESNDLSFENDSIKFSVEFNNLNYFCEIEVTNKTDKPIEIDWDKFLMIMNKTSYPILFDDTRLIFKNNPKGKSIIASETKLYKEIAPVEYIDYNTQLFTKKDIKKRGSKTISFQIPIIFNNQTKIFFCKILVFTK